MIILEAGNQTSLKGHPHIQWKVPSFCLDFIAVWSINVIQGLVSFQINVQLRRLYDP